MLVASGHFDKEALGLVMENIACFQVPGIERMRIALSESL